MKFTKKIVLLLVVLALALSVAFGIVACKQEEPAPSTINVESTGDSVVVGYSVDGAIVFTYSKAVLADATGKHVKDYFDALVTKGLLTYDAPGGFVSTIFGKGVDSSKNEFWAFYTTDTEKSSDDYGDPIEIDGKTYHSASYGIVDMPLKAGESYAFKVATW